MAVSYSSPFTTHYYVLLSCTQTQALNSLTTFVRLSLTHLGFWWDLKSREFKEQLWDKCLLWCLWEYVVRILSVTAVRLTRLDTVWLLSTGGGSTPTVATGTGTVSITSLTSTTSGVAVTSHGGVTRSELHSEVADWVSRTSSTGTGSSWRLISAPITASLSHTVMNEWVSEQILNSTSAQLGYTVPFTSVHAGK